MTTAAILTLSTDSHFDRFYDNFEFFGVVSVGALVIMNSIAESSALRVRCSHNFHRRCRYKHIAETGSLNHKNNWDLCCGPCAVGWPLDDLSVGSSDNNFTSSLIHYQSKATAQTYDAGFDGKQLPDRCSHSFLAAGGSIKE